MRKAILLGAGLLIIGSLAFADTIYVIEKSAPVKEEPKGTAKTVGEVPFKTKLDGTLKGKWYEIQFAGKTAYVFSGKVSATEPSDDPSLKGEGGNVDVAGIETAGAARGLGPTAEAYVKENKIDPKHKETIDYMQSKELRAPKGEIEKFLQDGKVGMYAE